MVAWWVVGKAALWVGKRAAMKVAMLVASKVVKSVDDWAAKWVAWTDETKAGCLVDLLAGPLRNGSVLKLVALMVEMLDNWSVAL